MKWNITQFKDLGLSAKRGLPCYFVNLIALVCVTHTSKLVASPLPTPQFYPQTNVTVLIEYFLKIDKNLF